MERWEYLLVRVLTGGMGMTYDLEPHQRDLEANLHNVGPSHTVALLDELGQRGWELVSVDVQRDTYWLKKRVAGEDGTVDILDTIR